MLGHLTWVAAGSGAKPKIKGHLPLLAVAADGPVQVVKSILDANIDVNEVHATTGHTGLHLAAKAGRDDLLQLMLDKVPFRLIKFPINNADLGSLGAGNRPALATWLSPFARAADVIGGLEALVAALPRRAACLVASPLALAMLNSLAPATLDRPTAV